MYAGLQFASTHPESPLRIDSHGPWARSLFPDYQWLSAIASHEANFMMNKAGLLFVQQTDFSLQ